MARLPKEVVYSITLFVSVSTLTLLGFFKNIDRFVYDNLYINNVLVKIVSTSASIEFLIVIAITFIATDIARRKAVSKPTIEFLTVLAVASVMDVLLKLLFRLPRPGVNIDTYSLSLEAIQFYGYPSGHAARAIAISMLWSRKLSLPYTLSLYLWAGAVCLSRILLRVHWFSDVLGGIAVGFLVYFISENLFPHIYGVAKRLLSKLIE